MDYFGLTKNDIDENGYVTLYHGTVNPPKTLKKGKIFFMTASEYVAKDYANMRSKETGKKGIIMTLKVKPDDVAWNQGSGEVEFTKGGKIVNGKIIPNERKKSTHVNKKADTYKNIKAGDILPKTKNKIIDIVVHPNGNAQFLIDMGKGKMWYDANMVLNYEFK